PGDAARPAALHGVPGETRPATGAFGAGLRGGGRTLTAPLRGATTAAGCPRRGRALPMTDEQRCELLKDEYLQLEAAIRELDGRALAIKASSVTFSMVAVVGWFAAAAPAAFLIASLGSCLFWHIECMWKTFQYAFYERVNQIEEYFAGKADCPTPLQTGRA